MFKKNYKCGFGPIPVPVVLVLLYLKEVVKKGQLADLEPQFFL
jgi:hypothetical protein